MGTMAFSEAHVPGVKSTSEAFALFDSLDAVDAGFMLGSWKGASFPTSHALDGVLEAFHWHGKRFDSPEHVHPLVFVTGKGTKVNFNPALVPFVRHVDRLPVPKSTIAGRLFQLCLPLFATRRSRARLRMTQYRGKESATMIYDDLPINDVFRKIDDDTVLGVMDCKDMRQPFFFILRRE